MSAVSSSVAVLPASFKRPATPDPTSLSLLMPEPGADGIHLTPLLSMRGVAKSYAGKSILKDLNLEVAQGEFVAIVGFSGSGKSTLLNLLAGLQKPDRGQIELLGKPITGPGLDRGVVFQNYSLMPWLSVYDNIALAVGQARSVASKAEQHSQTMHYIDMVNLTPARDKTPAQLSGGMRQRVSLARALALQAKILLLDEPLSALDALTRARLQDELMRICEQERTTVLLITNDVDEAILLADRVIPLTPGPGACFGPAFDIELARPRDRLKINQDKPFIALRKTITQCLLSLGSSRASHSAVELQLPDIKPITARAHALPGGVRSEPPDEQAQPRYVELWRVSKDYPNPNSAAKGSGAGLTRVVDDFNLQIARREFVSIIGHSGCGKSTVLSMLAGLTEISEGGIVVDNKEIDGAGLDRALVFQAPSLVPWLTALENVRLGVDQVYPHARSDERHDIARYFLTRVGLGDAMDKRASDLSNGMRQRVGIARAFALSPKVLLLDEPFGMLDSLTRWELQTVLMEVWERVHLTAVLVTHDIDEAILLADRVVMMTNGPNARVGKILKIDLPRPRSRQALLDHPRYYELRGELLDFLGQH